MSTQRTAPQNAPAPQTDFAFASGPFITKLLSSGRTVQASRCDDGTRWCFKLQSVTGEIKKIALSREAFDAMVELVDLMKEQEAGTDYAALAP